MENYRLEMNLILIIKNKFRIFILYPYLKFNLTSENTGRHATYKIKLYNLYGRVVDFRDDYISEVNICIYSDELINQFRDLDNLINRYKQMHYKVNNDFVGKSAHGSKMIVIKLKK